MPLKPLVPDKNASLRAAIRAVDSKVRPDFRRAIVCAVLAFTLDGAAPYFGGVHAATLDRRLAAYGTAAGFVVFGLAATRSVANELTRVSLSRAGAAAATPLRVGCLLIGYLIVALTAMDLFALPVGNLLVGGAVTGMILGTAGEVVESQQTACHCGHSGTRCTSENTKSAAAPVPAHDLSGCARSSAGSSVDCPGAVHHRGAIIVVHPSFCRPCR